MFLDFETIKKDNPIDRAATLLGLKLTKKGDQLRGPCPSGEGGDRAFVITPTKGAWYSFAKQTGGDVIALVAFVKGISAKDAAQFLHDQSSTVPEKKSSPSSSNVQPSEGFKALEYLEADHEAVKALGFDPIDAERLGIGYAPRGVLRGTVAVPVRLPDGKLAGYIGLIDGKLPPKWSL